MEKSIASVKIYGQEYRISGDKSTEYIQKVAAYVDENMHAIAPLLGGAPSPSLAVLAAVNIADEYFEAEAQLASQEALCEQKDGELTRYIELWEEAKKNFIRFREEAERLAAQREQLRAELSDKEKEIAQLKAALAAQAADGEAARSGSEEKLAEAEARAHEAESNFFDLQMENIRIKSELERFKRAQDQF